MKRTLIVLVACACAAVLAACGDDDGGSVRETGSVSGSGSGSGPGSGSGSAVAAECETVGNADDADTTVAVVLDEFTITVDADEAPAGSIHFAVKNEGEEPHELVVIQGVAPADLPLDDNGALDEAGLPDGALIGEVEPFPGGDTCDGTFDLAAGDYTLVCNITEEEEGEMESHLHEGMVTSFTVTK
jgi:hypothetical protein